MGPIMNALRQESLLSVPLESPFNFAEALSGASSCLGASSSGGLGLPAGPAIDAQVIESMPVWITSSSETSITSRRLTRHQKGDLSAPLI